MRPARLSLAIGQFWGHRTRLWRWLCGHDAHSSVADLKRPHVLAYLDQRLATGHPPHVALITRAQVKTDQKAALAMAQLLAAGLLVGIWIPPQPIRDARAVVAQRFKMVRLQTQAKNRLRSVLHRHHLAAPEKPFSPEQRAWWEQLDLSVLEKVNIQCDLDTLASAHG